MITNEKKPLTHIVGTFLIQAEGSFLNGSMSETDDGYNITTPKTLQEFNNKIPYVSAQAWRRWLRNTFLEEYPDEHGTKIIAVGIGKGEDKEDLSADEAGYEERNPIKFPELDVFGYMKARGNEDKKKNKGKDDEDVLSTIRSSPFQSSILLSVRKTGWEGKDKGATPTKGIAISWYKEELENLINKPALNDDNKKTLNDLASSLQQESDCEKVESILTALNCKSDDEKEEIAKAVKRINSARATTMLFRTRFYNTHLQGVFGLAFHRIGLFRNAGDRIELEKKYLKLDAVEEVPQNDPEIPKNDKTSRYYRIKDKNVKVNRTEMILKSLALLRGGAKQSQFGTDVSPKVIILAGLSSGNLIFNDLFEDTKEFVTNGREKDGEVFESQVAGGVRLKIDTLKQTIWDYRDRLVTPVFIGVRTGYLSKSCEAELKAWAKNPDWKVDGFTYSDSTTQNKSDTPTIHFGSPIDAVNKLIETIKQKNGKP